MPEKLWHPYCDTSLRNPQDMPELTFPYVLRYTQMRPRQLIVLCNAIAHQALTDQTFRCFQPKAINERTGCVECSICIIWG